MSARTGLSVAGALILGVALVVALRHGRATGPAVSDARRAAGVRCAQVTGAFSDHHSYAWLTLAGHVSRLLHDTYGRYQHQRFLVRCASGLTVLVVNDVSIGRRVPIRPGDEVAVHGQYVWNRLGGLIHFTHHSNGGGQAGWILYRDRVYAWIRFRTKRWKTFVAGAPEVDGAPRTRSRGTLALVGAYRIRVPVKAGHAANGRGMPHRGVGLMRYARTTVPLHSADSDATRASTNPPSAHDITRDSSVDTIPAG